MTLLVTVFAAVISTVVWYMTVQKTDMKLGMLCLLYWGASIMWFVDAIYGYAKNPYGIFHPAAGDMLNDFFLGLCVVAFGLVIWLVRFLLADPKGVIADKLTKTGPSRQTNTPAGADATTQRRGIRQTNMAAGADAMANGSGMPS